MYFIIRKNGFKDLFFIYYTMCGEVMYGKYLFLKYLKNAEITLFPYVFQKIPLVFQNFHLNIRKSQLYFRNLNSISENFNWISENVICLVSCLYNYVYFLKYNLHFLKWDFLLFNWEFGNTIGIFWFILLFSEIKLEKDISSLIKKKNKLQPDGC